MPIYALGDRVPDIHPDAFVHPDAVIIGSVTIGAQSSVWPCAVLRADSGEIRVGERSSVQDGSVIHCTPDLPTVIGDDCVVGHIDHLEGCTIHDRTLVGNGSIVLHRAVVGPDALVGSNAVVTNDMVVPPGAMALGVPAKLRENAVQPGAAAFGAASYVANGARFKRELRRID